MKKKIRLLSRKCEDLHEVVSQVGTHQSTQKSEPMPFLYLMLDLNMQCLHMQCIRSIKCQLKIKSHHEIMPTVIFSLCVQSGNFHQWLIYRIYRTTSPHMYSSIMARGSFLQVENFRYLGKNANIWMIFLSFDFNYKWHYKNSKRLR